MGQYWCASRFANEEKGLHSLPHSLQTICDSSYIYPLDCERQLCADADLPPHFDRIVRPILWLTLSLENPD